MKLASTYTTYTSHQISKLNRFISHSISKTEHENIGKWLNMEVKVRQDEHTTSFIYDHDHEPASELNFADFVFYQIMLLLCWSSQQISQISIEMVQKIESQIFWTCFDVKCQENKWRGKTINPVDKILRSRINEGFCTIL